VGEDDLGDRLESALAEFGVIAHLARKPTVTGRSINLNWDSGCRHFISSLPNNQSMTVDDIDVPGLIASGCRQMLRADVWFSESMLAEGNDFLFEQVCTAGIETYMDINWDPEWSVAGNQVRIQQRRGHLRRILPFVRHAHGNERELAFFTECENVRDACRFLLDCGCQEVVVHRGARGAASFSAKEGWVEVPATPVDAVVCSTGCGDVFCAAHMLLAGLPTIERLTAGARIAGDHLSGRLTLIPRLSGRNGARGRSRDIHATISG
jgi:sugar/nucleoside kinase (ribokinase family)